MNDNLHLHEHISSQFSSELEDIRNRVLAMGGLVEQQVADAVSALIDGDSDRCNKVVEQDYRVNRAEVNIDEECSRILARRQPTATDLRLVVAVIKTITDLERIGDEAEKIARMGINLAAKDRPAGGYRQVQKFSESVAKILHDSLDCFARMDAEAAVEVVRQDIHVDQEYNDITRQSMTFMMEDPRTISRMLDVLWAVRALERIGDHATNMAEYVIYLVKGKDVRHIGVDEVAERVGVTLK